MSRGCEDFKCPGCTETNAEEIVIEESIVEESNENNAEEVMIEESTVEEHNKETTFAETLVETNVDGCVKHLQELAEELAKTDNKENMLTNRGGAQRRFRV